MGIGRQTGLGLIGVWGVALAARTMTERRFAGRTVGRVVSGESLPGVVDVGDRLWRGPAPTPAGHRELAALGVTLVVDLRAEAGEATARALAKRSGIELLWLPTPNGRAPHPAHVERLTQRHTANAGITYVHCQAGEGRTGAIVGAYQVARGTPIAESIGDALAVGSLTFSQLAFIASGGRARFTAQLFDWAIDRPTEALFDLARRRHR